MVADLGRRHAEELRRPLFLVAVRLGVVVVDPHRLGAAGPQRVQLLGGAAHAGAVAARLADEHHRGEAAGLQAAPGADQQLDEAILGQRDRARLAHVAGRRIPAALGHVGDDGRHQRPADGAGDLVGGPGHHELVFAVDHVRALLLGARGADDDGGPPRLDEVAGLGPGQLFEEDAVGRGAARAGGRSVGRPLCGGGHSESQGDDWHGQQRSKCHGGSPQAVPAIQPTPAGWFDSSTISAAPSRVERRRPVGKPPRSTCPVEVRRDGFERHVAELRRVGRPGVHVDRALAANQLGDDLRRDVARRLPRHVNHPQLHLQRPVAMAFGAGGEREKQQLAAVGRWMREPVLQRVVRDALGLLVVRTAAVGGNAPDVPAAASAVRVEVDPPSVR